MGEEREAAVQRKLALPAIPMPKHQPAGSKVGASWVGALGDEGRERGEPEKGGEGRSAVDGEPEEKGAEGWSAEDTDSETGTDLEPPLPAAPAPAHPPPSCSLGTAAPRGSPLCAAPLLPHGQRPVFVRPRPREKVGREGGEQ